MFKLFLIHQKIENSFKVSCFTSMFQKIMTLRKTKKDNSVKTINTNKLEREKNNQWGDWFFLKKISTKGFRVIKWN